MKKKKTEWWKKYTFFQLEKLTTVKPTFDSDLKFRNVENIE